MYTHDRNVYGERDISENPHKPNQLKPMILNSNGSCEKVSVLLSRAFCGIYDNP